MAASSSEGSLEAFRSGLCHHIDGRQPGRLVAIQSERALNVLEVGRDQGVAHRARDADQHADQEVVHAACGGMIRRCGRARHHRPLVRLELVFARLGHGRDRTAWGERPQ